ncbi:hypothetical protein [Bradyrhizobium sp. CW10]|uniref:hypothetical protein n=1 Tax=Bradyrhizobium sp. CW10 TaxID=2782683 RepID=UPI001FF79B7F|nr:hypothetical protein [Bradyrhizobium sp. CW10]MCK1469853.1 hypothetical protein [Bradyrhizobium sp. CW10]
MRRRDFKTLVSGAALACPLMAGVQQQKQVFRIGFLKLMAARHFPEFASLLNWLPEYFVLPSLEITSG